MCWPYGPYAARCICYGNQFTVSKYKTYLRQIVKQLCINLQTEMGRFKKHNLPKYV